MSDFNDFAPPKLKGPITQRIGGLYMGAGHLWNLFGCKRSSTTVNDVVLLLAME